MAKQFTAESGLGFMRFIQFTNFFSLLIYFISLSLFTTTQMNALSGYSFVMLIVSIVGQAILIWMISNRKKVGRWYAIGFYLFVFVDNIISSLLIDPTPEVDFIGAVIGAGLFTLPFVLYFATSRRVKAVMVRPFASGLHNKNLAIGRKMYNPRSLDFWLRLLIYFFVFSVAGHWMEMGLQVLIVNGWFPGTIATPDSLTWKDHFGPFCIYGIAFAFCGLALYPLYLKMREKFPKAWMAYACSFLVNALFCAAAELALGLAFNADLSAWDYSDQFLNFQGQVCFLYTVCFGVVSSLIVWQAYPALERQFSYVGRDAFRVIFVGSAALFLMLILAYNIDPAQTFGFTVETDAGAANVSA